MVNDEIINFIDDAYIDKDEVIKNIQKLIKSFVNSILNSFLISILSFKYNL